MTVEVWAIAPDGNRENITAHALGRDVADYLYRARACGLSDAEIGDDLHDEIARSPIPADDVRVRGRLVEIELFDPE